MSTDAIGTIGAAGLTAVGVLFATGMAYKAIDSTMKSSGMYKPTRRSTKRQPKSIWTDF